MSFLVMLAFALPLLIGTLVIAVKVLEFALNRDIASAKTIARRTTFFVVGAVVLAVALWFLALAEAGG